MIDNEETVRKLQEYIELESSDTTEVFQALCYLNTRPYLLSEKFNAALKEELEDQLNEIEQSTYIEEHEEQVTRKYKTLEWYD